MNDCCIITRLIVALLALVVVFPVGAQERREVPKPSLGRHMTTPSVATFYHGKIGATATHKSSYSFSLRRAAVVTPDATWP